MEPSALIVLSSHEPAKHFARDQVYFAFCTGSLQYNCAVCNASCCRGHGYSLGNMSQLHDQIAVRPAVSVFFDVRGTGTSNRIDVLNAPPGCFFLGEGGTCEIHRERGYAAKPEMCRLFPFNILRVVADTLVVRPHPGLCPLQVTSDNASAQSDHDTLFADMCAQPLSAQAPIATLGSVSLDSESIVLERRLLSATAAHLQAPTTIFSYLSEQSWLTRQSAGETVDISDARVEIEESHRHIAALLGMSPRHQTMADPRLLREFIAATPSIRAELLFDDSAGLAPPITRLPQFLLGLFLLAALAKDAGLPAVTYQGIRRILENDRELLALLAYADCRSSVDIPLTGRHLSSSGQLQKNIRANVVERLSGAQRPLAEILESEIADAKELRVARLRRVARLLCGSLESTTP